MTIRFRLGCSVMGILLLACTGAHAQFPMPTVYRMCTNFVCSPTPEYSSANAVCYDSSANSGIENLRAAETLNGGGTYHCIGNYGFECSFARSPQGCTTGISARPVQKCPQDSTASSGLCSCASSFQQAGDTCSGGKNNGNSACTVGNPCNPANGNKVEQQALVQGLHGFGLALAFNSYDDVVTRFGRRWRDTFNRRVLVDGVNAIAIRSDGVTLRFSPAGGAWVGDADVEDQLTELQDSAGARIGWQILTAQGDETETYDAAGRLTRIRSRSGLLQTLYYSDGTTGPGGGVVLDVNGNPTSKALPAGLLVAASDHFGRAIFFGYNAVGRITRAWDPAGGLYRFAYLNQDLLASITFPDGRSRTYVYNESVNTGGAYLPAALTGILDENGERFATYKYNAQGRAISTERAGATQRYALSYGTGSTVVTDPLGTARTYNFQSVLGAFKQTSVAGAPCPQCGAASQTPDPNGNFSSRVDWNGNRADYAYDLARNLESSRTEALTSAGGATAQTRTVSTQWHPVFRLPTGIAEPLRISTSTYDPDGSLCGARGALCARSVQATTDADGSQGFGAAPSGPPRTWTYTYNGNGSVLTTNGPRTDVADVTTYTYYANDDVDAGKRGNVATIANAAGHVTRLLEYNAHGQPTLILDPNGLATTLAYDERQRLRTRTVGGETTGYEYDGVGQLTRLTLPDGSFLTYTYDAAHRLTGMQDALGNRIAYTLDAMGNRTQEAIFDPANNLAQTRGRVYDSLNRLFQEIGAAAQVTQYAHDNQGNVASVTDPLNRVTSNAYDALNRLRQVTDPALGVTQYTYNGLDALTRVTDPRSLATNYTVDGLGNLTLQQSPDTGKTVNSYDAAGNLLSQTDAKGQTTAYAYDVLNRVTLITFEDGSKQAYGYDTGANGIGRLADITETDPANQVTSLTAYTYDAHGRVTSETRTIAGTPFVTAYAYDTAGRLGSITYPSGRAVAYGYDALGRVNEVITAKDNAVQTVVQNVSYHPFGGMTGYTFGNGQAYARTVDQDGRIASYTLGGANYAIAFDAASRITAIAESGNPSNASTYGYDALDRLTQAVLPATNFGYSYDAVGNRLTKTVGAATDLYAYQPTSNRIASVQPASGPLRGFTFDPNGSTIADGLNTYTYDARGRMVQAVSAAGTTRYQLNALGQRVRKTNAAGDTIFHYDARGGLIAESDPAGAVKREYLYLGDMPVGVVQYSLQAAAQGEIVLDNGSATFATTGTWPASTAVPGYFGANYQTHAPNGAPPGAIVVDNGGAGFSVTGTWPASTAVSGYVGTNYQHHVANGAPPSAVIADNASGSVTGTWPASTSVGGYYAANYQTHSSGTGANSFTWTLNVASAGSYEAYARWTQHSNRATNAKYSVNHAGGATVVTVNQRIGGGGWQLLGTYSFDAGATTVSLSDDANGYVIADAVMLVPPGAAPSTATWNAALPGSGSYEVFARWTQHPNRARNARYTVNHAGGATEVVVNQAAGGGNWNSLGTYSFNGAASVSLTDQADGYVIADAVMFLPSWAGSNTAAWTPNVAQAGTYEVYARWTQHANRATNATYTVSHSGGSTAVAVNQQAGGGAWNLLGTFALAPGTAHKVTLTDQANGYVIADAIRLVPVSVQAEQKLYFVHADHLNTPRLVADASGMTVWRKDNAEPFGHSVADENPSGLGVFEFPLGFLGQYHDKETGSWYNWMRTYSAMYGRYYEADPLGIAQTWPAVPWMGLNQIYAYASNRPLQFVDPTGLAPFPGYNWCGPGDNGRLPPTNCIDQACKDHDECYERCNVRAGNRWLPQNIPTKCPAVCDLELSRAHKKCNDEEFCRMPREQLPPLPPGA